MAVVGGAPVIKNGQDIEGVEAVIDKDATAALLAKEINAAELLILTDGSHVCLNWGKPNEQALTDVKVAEMKSYEFAAGSMGPKVDACCDFAEQTGGTGNIGDLHQALDVYEPNHRNTDLSVAVQPAFPQPANSLD